MKRKAHRGRALRRRYGRAVASRGPRVVYRMPMGGLVWAIPNSSLQIMWAGPGSRLRLGEVLKAGGSTTSIDHPTADGSYTNKKDATAAVRAFLAAGSK